MEFSKEVLVCVPFPRGWGGCSRASPGKSSFGFSWGLPSATFGIHNIHQQAGITEGGVIGGHAPGRRIGWAFPRLYITPVLDVACYLLAWRYLGGMFIKISVLSTAERVPVLHACGSSSPTCCRTSPASPWLAALLGGLFVGIGVGLIVRQGGSSGGDDALALVISKVAKCRLSFAYLFTDLTVLALSLSYIPLNRILFSVVTVTLSSFLIDQVQNFSLRRPEKA